MQKSAPSNWATFKLLCLAIGGQDTNTLPQCAAAGQLPLLFEPAKKEDLLPALAVRCEEQQVGLQSLSNTQRDALTQAQKANVMRNMQISAQAISLARCLNKQGISPLFLKGTIALLTNKTQNLGFRKQVDIDIIVEPEHIERASDALLEDGYQYLHMTPTAARQPIETPTAIRLSAAHHHLLPLAKAGYPATVELHKHFLPKWLQAKNPLTTLFATAREHSRNGANFRVPSPQQQLLHLLQGKVIHDGHVTRKSFPIRDACDLLAIIMEKDQIDWQQAEKTCGKPAALFPRLVTELLQGTRPNSATGPYLRKMEKRYNSNTYRKALDAKARIKHLAYSLRYSPGKLPAYLHRLGQEGS